MLLVLAFGRPRDAWLVMLNLPLALIGGVAGVFLAGGVLSVASMIGFITLFGIATRNGIMLVTHIRHLIEEEGVTDLREAVERGARERLIPILMTAMAAGLALIPLAVGGGRAGSEIQTPMAIVILCGLMTSTLLEYGGGADDVLTVWAAGNDAGDRGISRQMRIIHWLFVISAALFISGIGFIIAGARTAQAAAPVESAGAGDHPVASVKQIMAGIVAPAATAVFDSVGTIVDATGIHEKQPSTDAEWAALGASAAALVESAQPARHWRPGGRSAGLGRRCQRLSATRACWCSRRLRRRTPWVCWRRARHSTRRVTTAISGIKESEVTRNGIQNAK